MDNHHLSISRPSLHAPVGWSSIPALFRRTICLSPAPNSTNCLHPQVELSSRPCYFWIFSSRCQLAQPHFCRRRHASGMRHAPHPRLTPSIWEESPEGGCHEALRHTQPVGDNEGIEFATVSISRLTDKGWVDVTQAGTRACPSESVPAQPPTLRTPWPMKEPCLNLPCLPT
jgi:hypothetical protein